MNCDCSCEDNDLETPAVYSIVMRRARKQHVCCECGQPILPGQEYEIVNGLWNGEWDAFKTCKICVHIRNDYCPTCFEYGSLSNTIWNCLGVKLFDRQKAKGGETQ